MRNAKTITRSRCHPQRSSAGWLVRFCLLTGFLAMNCAHAACFPPPSGLVGWWPGDGNIADIASTNNGVLMGNATASYPGVVGTGFHFDGTNDYVQIFDSPNFHLANFTIETWVRFDQLDVPSTGPTLGQQYMVFKQNSQASFFEGFGLIKDRGTNAGGDAHSPANGDIFLLEVTSGATTIEASGVTVISTGVWYHVAATRGPNFIQLYVNGKLDAQSPVSFPQNYGNLPLYFGSSGQPAFDCKLSGALDEVSLYNRVLSSNEIAAIYQAGSAGKCESPASITVQPPGQTVTAGNSASFKASAIGTPPLSYQWQRNGTNLADGSFVSGTTSNRLTLSGAAVSDAGTYSVSVSNLLGVATNGTAILTVNNETNKPTVTLISPAVGAPPTNNPVTLSGAATDNVRVSQVLVSLNGAAATNASVILGATPKTATWSLPLPFNPGTNSVTVQSVDFAGNISAPVTRSVFFKAFAPLTILINGNGSVPAPAGTNLVLTASYTLTATPGTGFLFSNWVDSATSSTASSSKYTFVMRSNLTLTANFVTNQTIGAAGTYYGLFQSPVLGVNPESAGYFKVITTARQSFSGSLFLDGDALPFSGTFNLTGYGITTKPVTRKGKSALTLNLQLPFDGSDTLSGTITNADEGWFSLMTGNRSAFSGANPATNFQGTFTMLLPGFADASAGPGGEGYATITIAANGVVKAVGALGDNHSLAPLAAAVSKHGDWPLYAPAYVSAFNTGSNGLVKTYNGSLQGWIHFTNNVADATFTGDLFWNKTGWTNGFYDSGFSTEIIPLGSVYKAVSLPNTRDLFFTNAVVTLATGNLPGPLADNAIVSDKNAITLTTANSGGKYLFTAKSGLVSGTFTNPITGNPKASVKGVYLQSSNFNYIGGNFLGTNQSGSLLIQ